MNKQNYNKEKLKNMSKDARKDKILSKNPIKEKKKKWHEKNFLGNTKKEIK